MSHSSRPPQSLVAQTRLRSRSSVAFVRALTTVFASAALLAAAAGTADASPLQATQRITGPARTTYQYNGAQLGSAVAPLGDVNGDGLPDILVSTTQLYFGGNVWVVLGSRTPSNFALPSGDGRSFQLNAAGEVLSAAPGGDIDGDGYADILVRDTTRAFIIYGGPTVRDIDLLSGTDPRVTTVKSSIGLTDTGFVSAGDFNGDGKGDILIKRETDAAVILGAAARPATFDSTVAGARIVQIAGIKTCAWVYVIDYQCFTQSNTPVPVGDINGDGKADLYEPTKAFITLGRTGNASIPTSAPDSKSISITGLPSTNSSPGSFAVPGGLGDVTGDGVADFAILRDAGASTQRVKIIPGRRIASGTISAATEPSITVGDSGKVFDVRSAGDLDGDHRADIVVADTDGVRTMSLPATAPATVTVSGAVISGLPSLAAMPTQGDPPAFQMGTEVGVGVGDIDGDGQPDLAVGFPTLSDGGELRRGNLYLVTHGADQSPPILAAQGAIDQQSWPNTESQVTPSDFIASTPGVAKIHVNLLMPADVELAYRQVGSATPLFTERRNGLPAGATDVPWDGGTHGLAGAAGRYAIDLTPIDAAGNRGPTQTLPFTLDGEGQTPASVTVSLGQPALVPGAAPPTGPVWWPTLSGGCPGTVSGAFNAWNGGVAPAATPQTITPAVSGPSFAGDRCDLVINQPAGAGWHLFASINGAAATEVPTGTTSLATYALPSFTLVGGANTVALTERFTPTAATVPISLNSDAPWTVPVSDAAHPNTAALLPNNGGLLLTPATLTTRGFASDATHVLDPNHLRVDFDAQMDGTNGANGLVFGFEDASQPVFANVGSSVSLGWVGHIGTGFALVTAKGSLNPSANFIGITSGLARVNNYPTWLQTADPGKSLQNTTTHVTITTSGGVVTMAIDGVVKLTRKMTIVSPARLGFSAATGGLAERHLVKNLTVVNS